ncbi:hypothetical protein [Nocardia iowensis]|nr:hypothetical protein [Nocardia iowensis]
MNDTVRIRRAADGLWIIAPDGAPTVLDGAAGSDVLVLEVAGGHLTWQLFGGQTIPAAVIDDVQLAQEWLWAVFGEEIALAVDAGGTGEFGVVPGLPELVASAWRLGYAHWAARWWPASIIDGIAPLDERLLLDEIAALSGECEMLVDGADASFVAQTGQLPGIRGRTDDYALAAGPATSVPSGVLVLARGTGGWDWRHCPPGLLDASDNAVSWAVVRGAGTTTVLVRVVAAPQLRGDVPRHLLPHALVRTAAGTIEATLALDGDAWTTEVTAPVGAESGVAVQVSVPGVGVEDSAESSGPDNRQRVREFAALRLSRATETPDNLADAPLLAEMAAAASDSDF